MPSSIVERINPVPRFLPITLFIALALSVALAGCQSSDTESGDRGSGSEGNERTEDGESGEHGGESESDDEESGAQYGLNETFDQVRAGARLVLSYDSDANSFVGTVENTTEMMLTRVRVEVHLSNGIELGPTTPINLAPSETAEIVLPASSQSFTSWSAHPEVG